MISDAFLFGLLVGVGAIVGSGFISFILRWLLRQRNAFDEPQRIVHFTERTPAQVGRAATFAGWSLRGMVFVGLFAFWVFLRFRQPELADLLQDVVVQLLLLLLETVRAICEILIRQIRRI